jgi:flagellar biogenesis protein FliO
MESASGAMTLRENYLAKVSHWLTALARSWRSHPSRQLRLRETLALGERRFIAVVEFEQQNFLIAGTGSSVAMLTALPGKDCVEKNPVPEAVHEDVPTWKFASEGSARRLIRR